MRRLILAALIAAGTFTPAITEAVVQCKWGVNSAYQWIARTGDYLPSMWCAVGEEDSPIVRKALGQYRRTHP